MDIDCYFTTESSCFSTKKWTKHSFSMLLFKQIKCVCICARVGMCHCKFTGSILLIFFKICSIDKGSTEPESCWNWLILVKKYIVWSALLNTLWNALLKYILTRFI